jgi:hypothetical protein
MINQLNSQELTLRYVCDRVLELHNSIRFAGFVNNMGTIIAYQYRDGLDPLLKTNETELSFIDTVLRMRTRKDMEPKLGKTIYSLTLYEKVKRATILPDSEEDPILMASLDTNNNKGGIYHECLIREGILPLVSHFLKSFSDKKDLTFFHVNGDSRST